MSSVMLKAVLSRVVIHSRLKHRLLKLLSRANKVLLVVMVKICSSRECRSQWQQNLPLLHSSRDRRQKTACRMARLKMKRVIQQWPAVLNHPLPHRTPLLPTALAHVLRPVLSLRLIKLALHQRQSRKSRQNELRAGGKHPDGSPPRLLWLVEGRGQQARRVQAGVGVERQLLLLEQLNSHPGGQLLEALLASVADHDHNFLVEVSVSRAWQTGINLFVCCSRDSLQCFA